MGIMIQKSGRESKPLIMGFHRCSFGLVVVGIMLCWFRILLLSVFLGRIRRESVHRRAG